MDVRILSRHAQEDHADQDPNVGSRPYLDAYSWLLRDEEQQHIGRNLELHYQWAWVEEKAKMTFSFEREGGSLPNLTKLAEGLLQLIPRPIRISDSLVEPCRLVGKMVQRAFSSLQDSRSLHLAEPPSASQQIMEQGYTFFQVVSPGLDAILAKPVISLSPDAASTILEDLGNIYRSALALNEDLAQTLSQEESVLFRDISQRLYHVALSTKWKLVILMKLIKSTQMQLRVIGVTKMSTLLINVYNAHKGHSPPQESHILLYLADLMNNHQIIEYLVSTTGAHPEILTESSNILGFLIVTQTYHQVDTIWHTVCTNPDARIVEATLRMVSKVFNLHELDSLRVLCKKAKDLPLHTFSPAMRAFLGDLMKELVVKSRVEPSLSPEPYDLCVRLVRDSCTTPSQNQSEDLQTQSWAATMLRDLLPHGPTPEKRDEIYRDCISDMRTIPRSSTTPGSILVINTFLQRNLNMNHELHELTNQQGLTGLIIQELESALAEDHTSGLQAQDSPANPANAARRELIEAIIKIEPSTISPELGARLWNLLVGPKSKSNVEREIWWQKLNGITRQASEKNDFINACFKDHLPTLPPDYFTVGALQFAKQAIRSWLEKLLEPAEGDQPFESIALEELWRMILTAPLNTIDASAIEILVGAYVKDRYILSLARTKARTIHLTLVNRCLGQLADAANKLRAFDGHGSSDAVDDGMALVASEADFREQETIFARSLAVLREFLQAYQASKQFSLPKPRSQKVNPASVVETEPLAIKYQSFPIDSQKPSGIQPLSLESNTVGSLLASIQRETGFENYKVFCAGKQLELEEIDVSKSVHDLNIIGTLLVQQREGVDPSPRSPSNNTTLELEIMKHFDKLWGYLDMHEKVAKEVSLEMSPSD
jgi:ubiquitin carboxyl-terminal hydrolase 34